ncbi:MAG: threonine--tRNA ligase, partial [Bacteroidetes bacterium]|nr:threonine--tRNA ligase [Bacteroidota bacterium]
CAGQFPLWLTPEQVRLLPVSEKFNEYAKSVATELKNYDIRASVDESNEKVGKKIREAELARVPYMLIIGEQEQQAGTVSARKKGTGDVGVLSIAEFATQVQNEIKEMLSA